MDTVRSPNPDQTVPLRAHKKICNLNFRDFRVIKEMLK